MMFTVSAPSVSYEGLFEAVPVAISVIDTLGRQVACNQAYAGLFGYSLAEVAELDVGRITRTTDRDWTLAYLTRLVSGEIDEYVTDKVYVRRDGSEFTGRLTARALRDSAGECSFLVATIVPADRRSAADAPSGVNRLLEFTTDTVTVVDVDGTVLETTGRSIAALGYPAEFWNERSILDLVLDEEQSRLLELRDQVIAEPDKPIETEIQVRAADGSTATLAAFAVNRLDDPDVRGIVLTTRNITEHLQAMSELVYRRDTAEAVADAQTRLLATVSHELRNPLHAVQGLAELLTEEALPQAAADLAETLRRQLVSLTQVTQDLLDAARFDAGEIVFEPEPTDLPSLVRDTAAVARAAVRNRPVEVSSQVGSDVPEWVMVDDARLRQILTNLVGNAVKFTPSGSVDIVVRADGPDAVMLSVIDTGVGIPDDERPAIVEPFRVASTGGAERGAGLGLSIVQRLVDALDGRLTVTSEVGRGSRFDVRLPLEPAAPPSTSPDVEARRGMQVLVVEDNPVNQQLARSQLERLGMVATIVGTGEDALELLDGPSGAAVDVILMDHQLPGISGLETTRRIRERGDAIGEVAIVGLSASASNAEVFLAAGMNAFVAKPASLADLASALSNTDAEVASGPAGGRRETDQSIDVEVDTATMDRLAEELGDREIVEQLVDVFLAELDGRIETITTSSGDDEVSGRAAHTLKSSARLLGATSLADACQAIELGESVDVDLPVIAGATRIRLAAWRQAEEPTDRAVRGDR